METSLKDKLKIYFKIETTDTSKDAILDTIISFSSDLIDAFGIDPSLQFAMAVEDYSYWLQSGQSSFEVSQASKGLDRYSTSLRYIIRRSMKVGAF